MSDDVLKDTEEIDSMNSVLDAVDIIEDMEAYTDILDHDSLRADDEIVIDGHLNLQQLEALVVLFKSKID